MPYAAADSGFSATARTARPTALRERLRAAAKATTARATTTMWTQTYGLLIGSQDGGSSPWVKRSPDEPPVIQAKRFTIIGNATATHSVTGPR